MTGDSRNVSSLPTGFVPMTSHHTPHLSRSAFLAAAAGLVLAACGGGREDSSSAAVDGAQDAPTGGSSSTGAPTGGSSSTGAPSSEAPADDAAPGAPSAGTSGTSGTAGTAGTSVPAALVGASTIDGAPFDAETLAGRPTVAWFWAPWCVICRGEAPDFADIAARYADRVNFIGVAGRGEATEMRDFVADTGTGAITHLNDSGGDIWASYEIYAQPAFAFIADDGRLETFVGSLGADDLAEIVDQLIVA